MNAAYTIRMNPNTTMANDWYNGYEGDGYTLEEARDLAGDLNNDLQLVDAAGLVKFHVKADGNYTAA